MKCEKCGKEIDSVVVRFFDRDGSDYETAVPLQECEENAVYIDIDYNWTGYELTEEEQRERILCPQCKQFPFKCEEIQIHEIVRAVMFKEDFTDFVDKSGKFKVALDEGAVAPTRAHDTDAGLDLYLPTNHEPVVLRRGDSLVIDTGVHIEIPVGCAGMIASKSGLNINFGILSTGVIDAGYPGSIRVKLYNQGPMHHRFEPGDKISQILILPVLLWGVEVVDKIGGGERGDNGFGSTGR